MPFIDLPDRIPGLRAQARGDRPWYQFRNVATDEAELFLYDEIGGFGTYAEDFISELKAITSPKLRVRVSSPGGSVFEGVALANALRAHPAEVTVQVDGIAASIASVIAMAGDRVVVQPQAMIMVHDAAGVCLGNAQDMIDMASLLDKISDNIADAYAEKAGGTRDDWRTRMRAESWFTAEEAVEAGLADEMMPARKPQPNEAEPEMRQFDLTAYGYTGPRQPEATLTEDVRSLIGEEVAAQLRAAVRPEATDPEGVAPPAPEPPVEPAAPDPAPEPEPGEQPNEEPDTTTVPGSTHDQPEPAAGDEPAPADEWAATVAHLINDEPDTWSVLVSNLTPTASSSAATEA